MASALKTDPRYERVLVQNGEVVLTLSDLEATTLRSILGRLEVSSIIDYEGTDAASAHMEIFNVLCGVGVERLIHKGQYRLLTNQKDKA